MMTFKDLENNGWTLRVNSGRPVAIRATGAHQVIVIYYWGDQDDKPLYIVGLDRANVHVKGFDNIEDCLRIANELAATEFMGGWAFPVFTEETHPELCALIEVAEEESSSGQATPWLEEEQK
jgi:hypothetical protein